MLELVAEGRSNRAIGELLGLTERTVEANVRVILSKLGLEPDAVTDPELGGATVEVLAQHRTRRVELRPIVGLEGVGVGVVGAVDAATETLLR